MSEDVLKCDAVRLQAAAGTTVPEITFGIAPGTVAVVQVVLRKLELADTLIGLQPTEAGVVQFNGRDWNDMGAFDAAAARGRIGRIFRPEHAWLSNLDVDENITLAVRHHRKWTAEEALERARALAVEMGLDALPEGRPPEVQEDVLTSLQCVRALLGDPLLVVVEYAASFMHETCLAHFAAALDRRRAEGLAVLWITHQEAAGFSETNQARYVLSDSGFTSIGGAL